MTSELYLAASAEKKARGERNDCTVIATSIVCGVSYEVAHAALEKFGRKPGVGAAPAVYLAAVKSLGFTVEKADLKVFLNKIPRGGKCLTSNTAARFPHIFEGQPPMMVSTKDHCFAIVDNKVHDWAAGRQLRIRQIWFVRPKDSQ
ncbi:hypothetical protein FDI24_gp016 [Acidovorax phage ACP17]|uniref:Uncharacterized protein n=1 Tax=Acidovorax phage ACP17 TaxID=2010329 RepID=A0A218M3C1_9CAUD|nr:hypothetical protein FDI24_gp016 [Acidovorax phage ACP17]ASD50550.1 hypothetical protein [Acidovorax phage ACP17]